ncbi:ferrochelatase [Planctomycetota bacterium]|nr:ferrochelatase [Planctomycetota bacterium]
MTADTLLVIGFGGPTEGCCKKHDECPGEAHCFVSGIFGDNPARQARVGEVVAHYEALGGFSKFNEITEAQAAAVQAELKSRGHDLNIFVGYDHWNPHISKKVKELADAGSKKFLTLVMSPHQSSISWDGYLRRVTEGMDALTNDKPVWAGVVDPWWNKAGFIDALAEHIEVAASAINADVTSNDTGLILSAHSVPESLVKTSPYTQQIAETAKLVAEKLGAANWMVAYQSGPSDSRIPWTSPFLEDAIPALVGKGAKKVIGAPIGFLCDNVEVLYDLGVEGKEEATKLGVEYISAEAVNLNPKFIKLLADQVEAKLA